ncbi:MAG: hypothetical protein GF344_01825 [Chitinivibrionales bacterium]|nr:hypothetical protein [Chitinivibrionales bacterium]MBD3355832.1 hypothetical protein [Chitinivibrionales bacterium]
MIVITGMHRSGTSCVAGLLARCGLSLGTTHPLLNESRFDNEMGHFENKTVIAINEVILQRAGGTWYNPSSPESILEAGAALVPSITHFTHRFDGRLVKDPRLCITMPIWERSCFALEGIVFCLRNPMAVAESLARRDGFPIEVGLAMWFEYNRRFVLNVPSLPLAILDYDTIAEDLSEKVSTALSRVGLEIFPREVEDRIGGFYNHRLNHNPGGGNRGAQVPDAVWELYEVLRAKALRPASHTLTAA